jgi:hypothetical protein
MFDIFFLHFPGARYHSAKREHWIRACHRGDKFVCTKPKDSYIYVAFILLDKMVLLKNIQTLYISAITSTENNKNNPNLRLALKCVRYVKDIYKLLEFACHILTSDI